MTPTQADLVRELWRSMAPTNQAARDFTKLLDSITEEEPRRALTERLVTSIPYTFQSLGELIPPTAEVLTPTELEEEPTGHFGEHPPIDPLELFGPTEEEDPHAHQ